MVKLTREQLAAIHTAKKVGLTKRDLFQSEVERRKMERAGGVIFMGEFVPAESPGNISMEDYVKLVREKEKYLSRTFPKKSKVLADKMIMEEIMMRDPEIKREFIRQPRITEMELEKMR